MELKKKQILYGATALVVLLIAVGAIAWQLWTSVDDEKTATTAPKQVWTCAMHPQIKMDKPGKCPLCGMNLIPLKPAVKEKSPNGKDSSVSLSAEAIALAHIQTTKVSRQQPVKEIQLYGTVAPDERLSQSQTAHLAGRIEKLAVSFTGESVQQGQTIATLYSPELLAAQQELLEAVRMQAEKPALLNAAREKLRLWKLTDSQIEEMEQNGKPSPYIDVKATTSGVVTDKKVNPGDYVGQGSVLFDVANLSKVWILLEAYETDLPFLHTGDRISYTLQALPGKSFEGRISFISPVADAATRTVSVRVEAANPRGDLKPGMYVDASVKAMLHRQAEKQSPIVVPRSAILWTGRRSIVYVRQPNTKIPTFALRQVELGESLGDAYIILSGLREGEEIATNGTFVIDASAQLEGKRSMMENEE
jgi:Cu(I)/Ag(I) efflux system membrane fusion protein